MAKAPKAPRRPQARSGPPGPVIASGILFIVFGAVMAVFGGVLLLVARSGPDTSSAPVSAAIFLVFALLLIITGVMVLRLSNGWRVVAIVFSALVVFGSLQSLSRGNVILTGESQGVAIAFRALTFLFPAANAFIIWALIRYRGAFRRARDR